MHNTTSHYPGIRRHPPRSLTAGQRRSRLAKRDTWIQQVNLLDAFNGLFDLLPALYVFIKNRRGEMMFFSRSMLRPLGIIEEADVIGLNDFDLTPAAMAEAYRDEDAAVLASGAPVLNHMELWFDQQGLPAWYLVNKLPLRSKTGRIVGIIGFMQDCHSREMLLPSHPSVAKAVALIRDNYHRPLSVREVAERAGLSPRQLERTFASVLGVSPQTFLIKTRVRAAARLLRETDRALAEIALACGFCDQSGLTRSFRQHVGVTPSRFRRNYNVDNKKLP